MCFQWSHKMCRTNSHSFVMGFGQSWYRLKACYLAGKFHNLILELMSVEIGYTILADFLSCLFQKALLPCSAPVSSIFNLFPVWFPHSFILFLPALPFSASLHAQFSLLVVLLVCHFYLTVVPLSGHRTLLLVAVSLRSRQWTETLVLEEVSPTSCR